MPWILTVSPRSLAAGGVEVTNRATGEKSRPADRGRRGVPRRAGPGARLTPALSPTDATCPARWSPRTTCTPGSRSTSTPRPRRSSSPGVRSSSATTRTSPATTPPRSTGRSGSTSPTTGSSDPDLRARYDAERLGPRAVAPVGRASGEPATGRGPRACRGPASRCPGDDAARRPPSAPGPTSSAATRRSGWRGSSTGSSGSRRTSSTGSTAAEPPPIAFLATVRRFVTGRGAGRVRRRRAGAGRAVSRPTDGPRSGFARGCWAWRRSWSCRAVPRRHPRRAVPRAGAGPPAAGLGGVDRPAALRPERRRGRRLRDRAATLTREELARVPARVAGDRRRRSAVAGRRWTATRTRRSGSRRSSRRATSAPPCRSTGSRRRWRPGRGGWPRGSAT